MKTGLCTCTINMEYGPTYRWKQAQVVDVNVVGVESGMAIFISGVPQGSVLRPVLFVKLVICRTMLDLRTGVSFC